MPSSKSKSNIFNKISVFNSNLTLNSRQLHTSAPLCGLFPNMGGEQSYRQTDKMGPNYELIYRNPLPKSVQFVKHATNACLIVLPYFLYQRCQEFIDNMWMTSEVIFPSYDAVTSSEIFWLGFLLLSHAVAIKIHVDSMALRVYRDGNKLVFFSYDQHLYAWCSV